ncbi:MAG TPA: histidine phosphatase family protein [Terriglobales bacterium]|nr:histidine phosphatase family protein [Terriglobales bacterium]
MLRIYIVRHATAQDRGGALPDFERSLVKKGTKEATAVARHLASANAAPDLMISSFANRAIETAHLFAKAFGYPHQKILLKDTFYGNTNTEDLAQEIRKQPDKYRSIMLVGHDPAFSQLAAHLVKGFREAIPKGGVVTAEFALDHWRDLAGGAGTLIEFTGPGRLKAQKKEARTELETRLARSMEGILGRVSRPGAAAFQKETRKAAHKLARDFLKTLNVRPPARPETSKRRAAR